MERNQVGEVAQVAHRQVGRLPADLVGGGCRQQHGDDFMIPRQVAHLDQVGAEILGGDPLRSCRLASGPQRELCLEQQLGQAQAFEPREPRSAQPVDLFVLESEADPVVVPSVIKGDDARSEGSDVAAQLLEPLVGRPAADAEGVAGNGDLGVQRANPPQEHSGVWPPGAGVAQKQDLGLASGDAGQRPVIPGRYPEEVGVGDESVFEHHRIRIAELDPLRGEREGEPDRAQNPFEQADRENRRAHEQAEVQDPSVASMELAPHGSSRRFTNGVPAVKRGPHTADCRCSRAPAAQGCEGLPAPSSPARGLLYRTPWAGRRPQVLGRATRKAVAGWLMVAVLPACAPSEAVDERIQVEPRGRLEVDLDLGDGLRPDPGSLEVLAHDANEVRILAHASGWGASGVRFRVDKTERGVRVYGRVEGAFAWLFGGPNIQVSIRVPREFALDLRCTAGPITVEEVNGPVRARTADASIEVIGAEGTVKLRTGSGDIRVSEVLGDVDVKVTRGDVTMRWITGSVEIDTERGEVDLVHIDGSILVRSDRGGIELREVNGHVDVKTERGGIFASFVGEPGGVLETSRGGIRVLIPSGRGAELDAVSRSGRVELGTGISVPGGGGGDRVRGPINGGGATLRLFTARGGIHVGQR